MRPSLTSTVWLAPDPRTPHRQDVDVDKRKRLRLQGGSRAKQQGQDGRESPHPLRCSHELEARAAPAVLGTVPWLRRRRPGPPVCRRPALRPDARQARGQGRPEGQDAGRHRHAGHDGAASGPHDPAGFRGAGHQAGGRPAGRHETGAKSRDGDRRRFADDHAAAADAARREGAGPGDLRGARPGPGPDLFRADRGGAGRALPVLVAGRDDRHAALDPDLRQPQRTHLERADHHLRGQAPGAVERQACVEHKQPLALAAEERARALPDHVGGRPSSTSKKTSGRGHPGRVPGSRPTARKT